jgi:hypothetical protein
VEDAHSGKERVGGHLPVREASGWKDPGEACGEPPYWKPHEKNRGRYGPDVDALRQLPPPFQSSLSPFVQTFVGRRWASTLVKRATPRKARRSQQ